MFFKIEAGLPLSIELKTYQQNFEEKENEKHNIKLSLSSAYLHALKVHVNLLVACKIFYGLFVIPVGKWSDGWTGIIIDIG